MFKHDIIIQNAEYKEFNPVLLGWENCKSGHSFGPALREYWLIHFVIDGEGVFTDVNTSYNVKKNDIFVIRPFRKTFYKADITNPWRYIWIGFTSESNLTNLLKPTMHLPEAARIFENMKNCENLENGRSAYLTGKIWELFGFIMNKSNPPATYVQRAVSCIEAEYMNPISVNEISERINIDRSYLTMLFREEIGMSPKQYIVKTRMEHAAELMTNYQQTPTIAALSVGYNDFPSFSKIFKKYYGLSPREYKKANGSEGIA